MQWPHAIVGAEPIIFNRDGRLRMLRANSLTTLIEVIQVDLHVTRAARLCVDDLVGCVSGGSVTGSLILMQQLEDKLKAHSYYVQFLKNVQLWDRVSASH